MTARELIAAVLEPKQPGKIPCGELTYFDPDGSNTCGDSTGSLCERCLVALHQQRLARMLQHALDGLTAFAGVRAEDVFSREVIAETAKRTLAAIEAECE